jgi:hypothetical protein
MRVYFDTSVIGGCIDPEFAEWSNRLFDEIKHGDKVAVISDQTLGELERAPKRVLELLDAIPISNKLFIELDDEARRLAREYIRHGATTSKHLIDAQHIAMATIHRVDFLASWNFKHMVNIYTIRKYNSVNVRLGYPLIDIRTPKELVHEGQ